MCHRSIVIDNCNTLTHTMRKYLYVMSLRVRRGSLASIIYQYQCATQTATGWAIRFALVPHTDNNTHQHTRTQRERVEYLSPERISI